MKDPAFLFYYQDFAFGTRKMTFEEKGAYIELLCEQADTGHLSMDDIKRIMKNSFYIWDAISNKFKIDDDGKYFNRVLENHLIKRRKYTESRKNNLKGKHKKPHMDNHMENRNININKNINEINKGECEGENTDDEIQKLWIRTFGKNPAQPEKRETRKLIEKFGMEKVHNTFYQAKLKGFYNLGTLIDALDTEGNIIPREKDKTEFTYKEMTEKIHKSGAGLKQSDFEIQPNKLWRLRNGKN